MKTRLKMDAVLLVLLIVVTGAVLFFPASYGMTQPSKDALDAVGVVCVIFGAALRMLARGHKKEFSQEGEGLVENGPYQYVRNPMYLGTFFAGIGFTMLGPPVWVLPVFVVLFYLRFIRLIRKEEGHLSIVFGPAYAEYCHRVPRFFPSWTGFWSMMRGDAVLWRHAWKTSEARMIFILPLTAVLVKIVTDAAIFQSVNPTRIVVYFAGWAVFSLALGRFIPRG